MFGADHRLVDRMETDGLVERSADPINRRATRLRLTAQGEERIAEAIAVHQPSARARFANVLSEQELDVLESITRKLRDANRANPAAASHHPNGQITRSGPKR